MIEQNPKFREQLLMGVKEIDCCGLKLKNYTLKEISELFGIDEYRKIIGIVTVKVPKELEVKGITLFDILFSSLYIKDMLIFITSFIGCDYDEIKKEYRIKPMYELNSVGIYYNGVFADINKENIQTIMDAFIAMYSIPTDVPDSQREGISKEHADLLRELEEETAKVNKANKTDISVLSIVESVGCMGVGYNLLTVWDLTVYQLFTIFKRTQTIKQYDYIMNGVYGGTVDTKNLKVEKIHWARDNNAMD